jgi:ATP-binding protein involved in chromosome partitioning
MWKMSHMGVRMQEICQLLSQFKPEEWALDLVSAGFVGTIRQDADVLQIELRIPFAGVSWLEELSVQLDTALIQLTGLERVEWLWQQDVATMARSTQVAGIAGVRNIIAVASGKGGVGKSTTAVNLALGLRQQGARVGVLDADIYGPSIPWMLGCPEERPVSLDGKFMQPVTAYGIGCNSIGFLVPEGEAAVWRGPMASKALAQILHETRWGELDYLIVDMPPGTGDIQLTLAQQVPTTAVVMVTTPQDIALIDVRKGIAMFDKVNIPVLGIVENMSYHTCSQCGHKEAIFGCGGGQQLAEQQGLCLLAQLPLHIQVREGMDAGHPPAIDANNPLAIGYLQLARTVAAKLYFGGKAIPSSILTINES